MSLIVIKVGGDILRSEQREVLSAVTGAVAAATQRGDRVLMIHGGGPQATALQQQLGQNPRKVGGRRITDEAGLDVMKMVVGGRLNIDMCAALVAAGVRPVGLHGASSLVIAGRKRPPRIIAGGGDTPIDLGLVGDITGINHELLDLLLDRGYTPVLACLAADESGQVLNINADVVANHLAQALRAQHLVFVTGVPGVLRDIDDVNSRIERMTVAEAREAIANGTVSGGMIAKLDESIAVVDSGAVGAVHIVGDVTSDDLLRAIDTPGFVGTALVP